MEVKYIRYIVALLLVLFQWVNVLGGADDWREELILEGAKKLDALIAQNKANEEAGRSHLNSYIVNLDGGWSQKGDFIEERGEGPNDKFTLLESDQLSLLDNDLKSFHALYSPKKEVGVYVIMVNNFQLLIRNQLPGNPEVQKLRDFAYYIDKDRQDQIKDLTKQMKGIVREVIDRTKNKGYTKQTYGILYGVISTYDLNSPDLTTGIIQDQLEPVSYLSVFMDKSAATPMESYRVINSEMPQGKDLVRSYAAVYPRLEALIKGFEKGYLKSRAIASLEEEAVALGIIEGPGRTLFMNLPKERTLTNEQKVAFVELCKYLNTETSGKTFAFYHPGLPNEIGQNGQDLYEQTWNYIYEKDLLTKEKFSAHFFQNQCRDVDLIFAHVDLWEGIDKNAYNKNSPDYLSPGKLYEYSFADFKVREGHKNTKLFGVIQALEEAGKAEPLSTSGHYDQYLAKWKTDAAYIFIANWSARWSKDILEAYTAQYVAASGVLSTKALKDAAIGSMVDYTLQVGLNWAFFAKDDATIEEIAKDVDFYQIAASGAENAFSSSFSNQRTQVLLSASISCMFDGSFEDGNLRKDFNLEECAKGIASAVIAHQVSNFALAKLQNLDTERLKRGLLRLGIPQKEWTRFLRWLGIKNADHIAEGVEKSLEELLSGLKKVVPSDQWDKFVDDFGKDAAKLAKFDANPKLVDSWKAVGKHTDLRTNTKFLENISGYSDDLLKQLDDDLLNPKWADELKAAFKESPEDVTNVWKKLKEDPAASWEISKTDPKWQKWGQREFFKDATKLGKQFEDVVTSKLLNKNSDLYRKLTSKLEELNLDISNYQIFNQVQLKYVGDDYFVGDFLMVRKEVNAVTGQVKNKAVIVEVKLNNATDLTTPQAGALNKVKGADKSLVVRSNSMNSIDDVHTLQKDLNVEVEDFVKVWSDGGGQNFSGLESLLK